MSEENKQARQGSVSGAADWQEALSFAIIEHLGPHALIGGKMSVIDAFEKGWEARAALASAPIAPAHPEQKPLGWLNSGELEHARKFGGSVNLWLKQWGLKEDMPVFLNATPAQDDARIASLEATVQREHQGMMNWKKTAEQNDAEIIELRKQVKVANAAGFAQCKEMAAQFVERVHRLDGVGDNIRALQCPDQPASRPESEKLEASGDFTVAELEQKLVNTLEENMQLDHSNKALSEKLQASEQDKVDELYQAWLKAGADLHGLPWREFMDAHDAINAARAAQEKAN